MTANGIAKPVKKKERKLKKSYKYILCITAVASIVYVSCGTSKIIFNSVFDNEKLQISEEVDYLSKIPEEVKNSNDPVIQSLLKKANNSHEVAMMLNNVDAYPKQLLELAANKDEVINFVANYPNYDASTNKNISVEDDYKKGEIPLFIQWDERWGYEKYGLDFLAVNGCGPTSLAMVAVGLTGNTDINPKVVAEFSENNGYLVQDVGSSWSLMTEGAKNFGVHGKELPLNENIIINTLKKGQPIIASMGPGTFTSSGHYLVLTGVDSNNNIIVNDSDSKIKSKQTWDIDIFMKEAKNLWAFTAI